MDWLITGGTGAIGKRLVNELVNHGHRVWVLTRDQTRAISGYAHDSITYLQTLAEFEHDFDVVVNLAGEPLVGRWTSEKKQLLIDSRVGVTKQVIQFLEKQQRSVPLFISGSAVGYYGHHAEHTFTEESEPIDSFSHMLCAQWEQAALKADSVAKRICLLRFGVVLDPASGFLKNLLIPFKLYCGATLGEGTQWFSWIHIADLLRIFFYLPENPAIEGAINCCAPNPVTNSEFTSILAKTLKRRVFIKMPSAPIRWLLGEMGDELLLSGQKVIPKKLLDNAFNFDYPELQYALTDLLEPALHEEETTSDAEIPPESK